MRRLDGRIALVSGAASGIGKASALRLAAEGARVVCADVNEAGAQATAAEIETKDGKAIAVRCDVTDPDQVAAAVKAAVSTYGKLDVLACIAGIGGFRRTIESSIDDWHKIIGVNLTGTFLLCRAALPHIVESRGSIITCGSVAGLKSHPYAAAYCASKGGVVMLTKALAVEYARKGVRVNCLCPGGVETPLISQFSLPEGGSQMALMRITPLDRMGKPEEIAAAVAFLASDDASYMNGATLVVDGGLSA
jgi:NAD(P)-dependent dehydrogenase (short-subunit alcohol dehydrogenase family)